MRKPAYKSKFVAIFASLGVVAIQISAMYINQLHNVSANPIYTAPNPNNTPIPTQNVDPTTSGQVMPATPVKKNNITSITKSKTTNKPIIYTCISPGGTSTPPFATNKCQSGYKLTKI
jgi:hypothetical protein